MTRRPKDQTLRAVAHLGFGAGIWVLKHWGWLAAVSFVSLVALLNLFVPARLGSVELRREDELRTRLWGGVTFPLAVALVLLLLRDHTRAAAAVWVLVAVGDSLAVLTGRRLGRSSPLPWNPEKSWIGTLVYLTAGGVASTWAWQWMGSGNDSRVAAVAICAAATCAAAVLETTKNLRDDNLAQVLVATFAIWVALRAAAVPFGALGPSGLEVLTVIGGHAILGTLLYFLGAVSVAGSVLGSACGVLVFLGLGWSGWGVLALMVGLGFAATRLGLEEKLVRSIAESDSGRRTGTQILAKGGVAAAMACLAGLQPGVMLWRLMFAGALAAAAADTLATEVGGRFGGRGLVLWKLRLRPPGTPGAISWIGTLAAVGGSLAVALMATAGLLPAGVALCVALGGLLASLAESLLAPPLEKAGLSTHELSNLLMTAVGALLTSWFAS